MFPEHLHLKKVCGVMWTSHGPAAQAEAATKPMRCVGKPLLDHQAEMPLPAVNSLFDALYPPGLQWYWRADFVKELQRRGDRAARRAWRSAADDALDDASVPDRRRGAPRRTRTTRAFSYRDANWAEVIVGVDPDPANAPTITTWCKDYFDALHPYSAGGAYVNFMMEEGQERVQAAFRDNYDRLAAVKDKYDPANLFRVNQNIRSAAVTV